MHPVRGTPDVQWTDISGDLPLSTESNSLRQRVNPADLLISPTDPSVLFIATIKDFQDFDPSDPIDFDDRPTGVFKTSNWKLVNDAKAAEGATVLFAQQNGPPLWVRIGPSEDGAGSVIELSGAILSQVDTAAAKPAS